MSQPWDTKLKEQAERLIMEQQTVRITVKQVYGRTLYYPENQTARTFADLIAQKTFTGEHLKLMEALGFKVESVAPSLPTSKAANG